MTDRFSLQKFREDKYARPYYLITTIPATFFAYRFFETEIQAKPENAALLESYTGIDEEILRNYGSDFFGAAFTPYLLGSAVVRSASMLSHAMNLSGTAAFIDKNYRLLRSATGLAGLAGFEYSKVGGNLSNFDLGNMVAYGLGIATLCHGRDIISFFKDTASSIFCKNTGLPTDPNQRQTLTP